eukprot:TRINITY_DN16654_c0_g1_i1.p1 TRINITY_DN16654_c0_g1~~TRINITY_DN16654_c0_g1_i1.p1  ORF type:complete len:197 (-),score=57.18 TRINITY_DN16654_c0_g1_i1:17-607(-)
MEERGRRVLEVVLRGVKAVSWKIWLEIGIWLLLFYVFIKIEFGLVYIILSFFYFMIRSMMGSKSTPGVSAYSVFNKDFKSLPGQFSAQEFEQSLRGGFAVPTNNNNSNSNDIDDGYEVEATATQGGIWNPNPAPILSGKKPEVKKKAKVSSGGGKVGGSSQTPHESVGSKQSSLLRPRTTININSDLQEALGQLKK